MKSTKLENNKKKKKDALFNTAFELFSINGLEKTTISDIAEKAGVAKGTFYLYFKDKLDIRNKLIAHKTGELFFKAYQALQETDIHEFESQLLFIVDFMLNDLNENRSLLVFISKNLGWGVFKSAFEGSIADEDYVFYHDYLDLLAQAEKTYHDPEIMLFTIVELVGSTCYSCILYETPVPLDAYKPHLYRAIRKILSSFEEDGSSIS